MNPPLSSKLEDKVIRITDDTRAQAFLLAECILDKLPSKNALADNRAIEINTIFCKHFAHATHWILACRIHGNLDEKENGFLIFGWPKNKWPKSVIDDAIRKQNLGVPDDVKVFTENDDKTNLS